jgi:hypothetical protein
MFKLMIVDDEPNVVEGIRDSIDWEQYGATVVALPTTESRRWSFVRAFAPILSLPTLNAGAERA